MTTKPKSAGSSKRSKHSPLGRRIIAGLKEAVAHAKGEIELPGYTVTVTKHPKTKRGPHQRPLRPAMGREA
jgi:hypothetical protein